jgi:hypothetical protein
MERFLEIIHLSVFLRLARTKYRTKPAEQVFQFSISDPFYRQLLLGFFTLPNP